MPRGRGSRRGCWHALKGWDYAVAMGSPIDGPELDYAFLAEFAKVDHDQLTAIGASYTHVTASQLPVTHQLYIAGRIRAPEGGDPFELEIAFQGASEGAPELKLSAEIDPAKVTSKPYDGKVGILFAVGTGVPLLAEGLYEVKLSIDGEIVRRLAFSVDVHAGA